MQDLELSVARTFIRVMFECKVPAKQVFKVIALVAADRKMSDDDTERLEMIAKGY